MAQQCCTAQVQLVKLVQQARHDCWSCCVSCNSTEAAAAAVALGMNQIQVRRVAGTWRVTATGGAGAYRPSEAE